MSYKLHDSGLFIREGKHGQQDINVINEVVYGNCYQINLRNSIGENEFVVDIGAHIGSFSSLWHKKNPLAKITCVEVCPENIPVLEANVGSYAKIHNAACSYETGDLFLANSIIENGGVATGGSTVLSEGNVTNFQFYWEDRRPIKKITLEEILAENNSDIIHVLKLDCEGSEFSILSNTEWINEHVHFICGEYHGREKWDKFRKEKYSNWYFGHMKIGKNIGIFHLANPKYLKG